MDVVVADHGIQHRRRRRAVAVEDVLHAGGLELLDQQIGAGSFDLDVAGGGARATIGAKVASTDSAAAAVKPAAVMPLRKPRRPTRPAMKARNQIAHGDLPRVKRAVSFFMGVH